MLHQSTVALERKCHPAVHVVPSSQSAAAGQGVGGKEASGEESRPLPSVLAVPVLSPHGYVHGTQRAARLEIVPQKWADRVSLLASADLVRRSQGYQRGTSD